MSIKNWINDQAEKLYNATLDDGEYTIEQLEDLAMDAVFYKEKYREMTDLYIEASAKCESCEAAEKPAKAAAPKKKITSRKKRS